MFERVAVKGIWRKFQKTDIDIHTEGQVEVYKLRKSDRGWAVYIHRQPGAIGEAEMNALKRACFEVITTQKPDWIYEVYAEVKFMFEGKQVVRNCTLYHLKEIGNVHESVYGFATEDEAIEYAERLFEYRQEA